MKTRFTLDGSPELETRLQCICDDVLAAVKSLVGDRLDALVLGGGYGRGEGGVLRTSLGDEPYNDLEFYVWVRGNRLLLEHTFRAPLACLADKLSAKAGLHVEFKVDTLAGLRRRPITMFSYDLVSRHRVIWSRYGLPGRPVAAADGSADEPRAAPGTIGAPLTELPPGSIFAGCESHLDAGSLPLSEGTRLLFNRCTGLLLAKEILKENEFTPSQSDFVGRNLAKTRLALGDAVLAASGLYHWSCIVRRDRFARSKVEDDPPGLEELRQFHAAGVEFKLHPVRATGSRAELVREHARISNMALRLWLWLENRRLRCRFSSALDYACSRVPKCNGTPKWRNLLSNARAFGLPAAFDGMGLRYPRERLLNSLALLLWEDPPPRSKSAAQLQKQLRTAASDWDGFTAAYKAAWPALS